MDTLWLDLRYALRSLTPEPRVRAGGRAHARARHRREHGDLQRRLLGAAPATRVRPARSSWSRSGPASAAAGAKDVPSSQPEYQDYQREVTALEDLAAIYPININFTGLG